MITIPLLFAAISAGLIGGFHCVGMCGGISILLSRLPLRKQLPLPSLDLTKMQKVIPIAISASVSAPNENSNQNATHEDQALLPMSQAWYRVLLHVGRLLTYMFIGALFGGIGSVSLLWKMNFPAHHFLYVLGNVALVLLGCRLLGFRFPDGASRFLAARSKSLLAYLTPLALKGSQHPILLGMSWGALPCGLSYVVAPFALLSGAAWSGAILMLVFGLAALPHLIVAQSFSRQQKNRPMFKVLQYFSACTLIALGSAGMFYFNLETIPSILCITPTYSTAFN
jgi:sulfite exporter TauE/SafE